MLEQWTLLRRARKAIGQGRLVEAYELTLDPAVRAHARSEALRSRALRGLLDRARRHHRCNNLSAAFADLRVVLAAGEVPPDALALERQVREGLRERDEAGRQRERQVRQAEREADFGLLREAHARLLALAPPPSPGEADSLLRRIEARIAEAGVHAAQARRSLAEGAVAEAQRALELAREIDPGHPALEELGAECARRRRERVVREVEERLARGDAPGAWEALAPERQGDPDIGEDPTHCRAAAAMRAHLEAQAHKALDRGAPAEAARILEERARIDPPPGEGQGGGPEAGGARPLPLARAARLWERGLQWLEAGEPGIARRLLEEAAREAPGAVALRRSIEQARELEEAGRGAPGKGDETHAGAVRLVVEAECAFHPGGGDREGVQRCLDLVDAALEAAAGLGLAQDLKRTVEREITALDRLEWGAAHEARGNLQEALRWYREGLDLAPAHPGCARRARRVGRRLGENLAADVRRELRAGRWEAAGRAARALAELAGAPAAARARAGEILRRLEAARSEAAKLEKETGGLLEEGRIPEARRALDRLLAGFPGYPGGIALRERIDRYEALRPEIEEIEERVSRGIPRDADALLKRLEGMEDDLPRVRELARRLRRGLGFQERFVLRVEEGSEYLVLTGDVIRIGNVLGEDLDLPVMANISRLHAEIRRTRSFHAGIRYELRALPGRDCFLNGEAVPGGTLSDGDRIRLGEGFEMRFRLPSPRSRTARLELAQGFEVDGIDKVLLMPPAGRDGRIVISTAAQGHVHAAKAEGTLEIYRAVRGPREGELVCRSPSGVLVDGEGGGSEEPLRPGCVAQCGACRIVVDAG